MPQLPTISAPSVQRAQYAGVPINLENALAPIRGSQAIAGAIGQAGQVLGEFAVRTARIREDGILAEQQRQQEAAFGQFQADLANIPDPDQWTAAWEKRSNELQKTIAMSQSKLGPDGKMRSQSMFKDWQVSNGIKVNTQSKLAIVKQAKASLTNQALLLAEQGDLEGARAQIERLDSEHNALSDPERKEWDQKITETAQRAEIEKAIASDPEGTQERLKSGEWEAISPEVRNHYALKARQQNERIREDWYRAIDEEILALQNGEPVDPESTVRKIKEGDGTAEQKRLLLNRVAGTQNPTASAAAIAALWDEVDTLDRNDPEFRTNVSRIRIALNHFDADIRKDVTAALDDKVRPDYKEKGPTEALQALQWMRDSGALGVFNFRQKPTEVETEERTKWFGYSPLGWLLGAPTSETVIVKDAQGRPLEKKDELGRPIIDEARWQRQLQDSMATQAFYGDLKRQLVDYAKSNPTATTEDHIKFIREKTKGRTDVVGADALFNPATGFSDSFLDDDAPQD